MLITSSSPDMFISASLSLDPKNSSQLQSWLYLFFVIRT